MEPVYFSGDYILKHKNKHIDGFTYLHWYKNVFLTSSIYYYISKEMLNLIYSSLMLNFLLIDFLTFHDYFFSLFKVFSYEGLFIPF